MKTSDTQRPTSERYVEKVANDTREYLVTLLDEIVRLRDRLSEVEEQSRDFAARYVEVEQQNTNLANLYVASYQLHGTLVRERVLEAIKEIVINLIGSEELAIWEMEEDALVLLDSFGIDEEPWQRMPLDPESGVIGFCSVTGERFVAGETEVAPKGREENLSACIPLRLDETVVGAIGVFKLLPQKTGFETIDLELFELLASHAASALYCTRTAVRS
ncbi:MAG TPA: GAF domain-containing protein [Thermoanaerobaculia bacterium]|nr:GAF domain-containing protein [Thermoanaerobaculia bacterium]